MERLLNLLSNDEYIKQIEESNRKIKSEPNYMETLLKKIWEE